MSSLIDVGSTTRIEAVDRQNRTPLAHVIEFFSRSTKRGEQYRDNLQKMYDKGIQIALKYAGCNGLYVVGRKPGQIVEAACWAHGRRYRSHRRSSCAGDGDAANGALGGGARAAAIYTLIETCW